MVQKLSQVEMRGIFFWQVRSKLSIIYAKYLQNLIPQLIASFWSLRIGLYFYHCSVTCFRTCSILKTSKRSSWSPNICGKFSVSPNICGNFSVTNIYGNFYNFVMWNVFKNIKLNLELVSWLCKCNISRHATPCSVERQPKCLQRNKVLISWKQRASSHPRPSVD